MISCTYFCVWLWTTSRSSHTVCSNSTNWTKQRCSRYNCCIVGAYASSYSRVFPKSHPPSLSRWTCQLSLMKLARKFYCSENLNCAFIFYIGIIFLSPGSLNPLQHMRDANENILKVIVNNVQESVDFLEKFIASCSVESIFRPRSECFCSQTNGQDSTAGSVFEFDWDKSDPVALDDIKNMVYTKLTQI